LLSYPYQPSRLVRRRTILPARGGPRGDKVPLRPGLVDIDFAGIRLSRRRLATSISGSPQIRKFRRCAR
jgi:hypothetical protein